MPRILVTNDDGYLSKGLYILYEAVKDLGETRIYSTEMPRSIISHTITINKPLRITRKVHEGYTVYLTDGTPIDALYLAIHLHNYKPDLVVSGVNVGENLTLQHIFYSGTIAVAIEAALNGIPALAFSADIQWFEDFENPKLKKTITIVARQLATHVLKEGLPEGVDLLNINIPNPDRLKPCIKLAKAARKRWTPEYIEYYDTRGRPCYWLKMKPLPPEPRTDVYHHNQGCITITPLNINLNTQTKPERKLEKLAGKIEKQLKNFLQPIKAE